MLVLWRSICFPDELEQNPPSIPTLLLAQLVSFLRGSKLIIDWHNTGYSILALKLGPGHPLVKIARWYVPRAVLLQGLGKADGCE